ncbi:hypothetical protein E1B28_007203 [Marasmius oreades]|uniref:Smr domain-containing protein n=1 Tax=Marasmius oreades TaxID=181124 RepID=A0A9P7S2I1_9AGAR|nr:uncharacterized protein E1B28_007203 [Marasmius oreades]KAG7093531.1 hypothetical protein E1B28_007203 [Marasmius oreades]
MSGDTRTLLADSLQKEFCPPLDTTLVLALLSDIDLETKAEIQSIREALRQLALESEVEVPEEASDLFPSETETETHPTSPGSSAIDFLRTVLPHISLERLRKAVTDAEMEGGDGDGNGNGDSDIDMWEIIAGLLTEEALREMEERGLDVGEDESTIPTAIDDWELVTNKNKTRKGKQKQKPLSSYSKPKAKTTTTTFAIADIRQQHRLLSSPPLATPLNGSLSVDPWTQINSFSTYLSTLLAPHEPSFFQSYFHSPEYESPYDAVLAAVTSISEDKKDRPEEADPVTLVSLLDILLPSTSSDSSNFAPDVTSHTQVHASTIELCLRATNGRPDDALDLLMLLQDLTSRSGEVGLYHTSPKLKSKTKTTSNITADSSLPPPLSLHQTTSTPTLPIGSIPQIKNKQPKPEQPPPPIWQTVPVRNSRSGGNGGGSGPGNGSGGEVLRARIEENLRRRNEMLREASRMWRKGGTSGAGAMYFAERAREFQELARKDSLSAARLLVESNSKRFSSETGNRNTNGHGNSGTTVDLHGTTVLEATQIVLEMLGRGRSKIPMKIITGKGTHSKGQVPVLKPAVKKALTAEGWLVSDLEGGLVVRGRGGRK